MAEINDLISIDVGQDFWQGASAHFKHRAASRSAARSDRVVCFMSPKFLYSLPFSVPAHLPWSQPAFCFWFRFQWALAFLLTKTLLSIFHTESATYQLLAAYWQHPFFVDSSSGLIQCPANQPTVSELFHLPHGERALEPSLFLPMLSSVCD